MPLVKTAAFAFYYSPQPKISFMKTKSTLFCLVFALCLNINTSNAQVNVQDSLALVDLYNSTDGPNWACIHTNWLTKKPVSTWEGITVTNKRVTSIQMCGLEGHLPSSIGNLTNLRTLDFSVNYGLSGSIPIEIGKLQKLHYLDLSYNQLSNIPSSIGNLINLTHLNLSNNQISGSIPSFIGNLINLQHLDLNGNQFTSIPSSLGNLVNLQYLSISDNQLMGTIPSSIGKLVNLTTLYLYNNHLSGSIPFSIGNLVKLRYLDFTYNELSGSIPSSIGNLRKLWFLQLNNNKLTGSIPFSIGNLNISGLDLSYNQLSGSIPSSIGTVGNGTLYLLNLSSNKLTGNIPASMGNLGGWLAYLLLRNNQLSGDIPPSLSNVGVDQIVGPGGETGLMTIDSNNLTFGGMEFLVQKIHAIDYSPQANIPVHQHDNTLSVYAGGTLSNNTYKWFKCEGTTSTLVATIKGDSIFHPSESGRYHVKVLNSVATQLKLYSRAIDYTAPNKAVIASAENALQQHDKTNLFLVYPNPARDILHVETNSNASFSLLNQSGKILLTKSINGNGEINVANLAAGLYYLRNNATDTAQKVIVAK